MIGVSNTNSADHTPQGDYEDIDESKIIVPPHNIVFENSIHDYSRTPQPLEMSNYELPVQSTMSKVYPSTTQTVYLFLMIKNGQSLSGKLKYFNSLFILYRCQDIRLLMLEYSTCPLRYAAILFVPSDHVHIMHVHAHTHTCHMSVPYTSHSLCCGIHAHKYYACSHNVIVIYEN